MGFFRFLRILIFRGKPEQWVLLEKEKKKLIPKEN